MIRELAKILELVARREPLAESLAESPQLLCQAASQPPPRTGPELLAEADQQEGLHARVDLAVTACAAAFQQV